MDISAVLLSIVVMLAATALCVILFQRLGFGAILGFIVAGVLIGPHTPGPVPVHAVDELQSISELGVVLFMFSVGLEMRPEKLWQMRRLIFGPDPAGAQACGVDRACAGVRHRSRGGHPHRVLPVSGRRVRLRYSWARRPLPDCSAVTGTPWRCWWWR